MIFKSLLENKLITLKDRHVDDGCTIRIYETTEMLIHEGETIKRFERITEEDSDYVLVMVDADIDNSDYALDDDIPVRFPEQKCCGGCKRYTKCVVVTYHTEDYQGEPIGVVKGTLAETTDKVKDLITKHIENWDTPPKDGFSLQEQKGDNYHCINVFDDTWSDTTDYEWYEVKETKLI